MSNTQNIIQAIGLILTLTERFVDISGEIKALIDQAQDEGRDITNEELDQLRAASQNALDTWLEG